MGRGSSVLSETSSYHTQRFFVVLATFRKVYYLQTQVHRVTVVLLSESLTQAYNHCRPDIDSQSETRAKPACATCNYVQLTAYIFVLYIVHKRGICNSTKMCRHSAILTLI